MARLIRLFLIGLVLATVSSAASALPVFALIGAWVVQVGVVQAILTAVTIASSIYGGISAKRKARRAAERAADAERASLKDRTATVISSEAPWVTVYGSPAPVGGSPVAVLASGEHDQFKHIVLVLASHPCEAVDEVYIAGKPLALDANGYATNQDFQLETTGERRSTDVVFEMVERAGTGDAGESFAFAAMGGYDGLGAKLLAVKGEGGEDLAGVLTFSASGFEGASLTGPLSAVGTRGTATIETDGPGSAIHITKHFSPGGVDVADAKLMAACPDKWTAAHKLSGFTYLVITLNLNLEQFQGGLPEFTAKLRGKKLFDPRTGQTVYSRNPALCLADFLRSEVGYRAAVEQIDLDAQIAAANACDVQAYDAGIANAAANKAEYGGTSLYTCDGMFRSDADRDTTRQQIEDAMAGYSMESGGVWRILAGVWTTPVMALVDDDMLAPVTVVQSCNTGTARYNTVKGTYIDATKTGVTEDFKPYANAVFVAADDKEKVLDMTLAFTAHHVRTQQIARVKVEQSRGGFVLQIRPKRSAWWLRPGDRITLSNAFLGFADKTFRVQDWTYERTSPLTLQVVEDEEAFYDLADETRADASPNTNLQNPFEKPAAPLGLTVESGPEHMLQQGATLIARTRVSWVQCTDARVLRSGAVRVQWMGEADAVDDATQEAQWKNADLPGDAASTYLTALDLNKLLRVRVRFETPYASSNWTYAAHLVDGDVEPPAPVTGLAVTPVPAGWLAQWAAPESDLVTATQIRVDGDDADDWETSTPAWTGKAESTTLPYMLAGVRQVRARHLINKTPSQADAVANVTVLLPGPASLVSLTQGARSVSIVYADPRTTQPIRSVEFRCHKIEAPTPWESATPLGSAGGAALGYTATFDRGGKYIVLWRAVDMAGNAGPITWAEASAEFSFEDIDGQILGGMLAPGLLAQIENIPEIDGLLADVEALAHEVEGIKDATDAVKDKIAATVIGSMISADAALKASAVRAKTELGESVAALDEFKVQTATKDEAVASRITVVAAELDGAKAAIVETQTTQATANAASAEYQTVVAARFGANESAIVTNASTSATAIAAQASRTDGITARVGTAEGAIVSNAATSATAIAAQATLITGITSRVGNAESAIVTEQNTRATAISAQASRTDGLTATVNNNQAAYLSKVDTLATTDSALSSRIDSLTATVGSNKALAATKTETAADIDSAKASVLGTLRAETSSAIASFQTAAQVAATVNSAQASNNSILRSEIGSVSAAAQFAYNTAANLSGNVSSSAMLKTEVVSNGKRFMSGIAVGVSATSAGVVQSEVLVNAWSFGVINSTENGGNVVVPFRVVDGVTYIDIARIKDADIGTLKIGGNAVTIPWSAGGGGTGQIPAGGGTWLLGDFYINPSYAMNVVCILSYGVGNSTGNVWYGDLDVTVAIDGQAIVYSPMSMRENFLFAGSGQGAMNIGAGSRRVTVIAKNKASSGEIYVSNWGVTLLGCMR